MKVIALEGVNGAGKSLVGGLIEQTLQTAGRSCLMTDPAGFGPIGRLLRRLVVHPGHEWNPDLDAGLFTALRAEGAKKILEIVQSQPLSVVVFERWSLALSAYGTADDANPQLISELRGILRSILSVDMTILLDVSGELASKRIAGAANPNRFESRGPQYLENVACWYRHFAAQEDATEVVDASGDAAATFERLHDVLATRWADFREIG